MIDIAKSEPKIIETKNRVLKLFPITVTIGKESHDFKISIYHNEDAKGKNTKLESMLIGTYHTWESDCVDLGLRIHECMEMWFDETFTESEEEKTAAEFDEIFAEVWEYIESKNLQ
jgi:hypothetical protein